MQTNKLRIFLIKLSHSSSTYENTFTFQHFTNRRSLRIWLELVLGIGRDFNIDNWLLNIDQYID